MYARDPAPSAGLFGTTISRSLSPAMHDAAFAYHGLPECYALWPVAEQDLAARVAGLRAAGMRGANVTIPHKSAALALVDELGRGGGGGAPPHSPPPPAPRPGPRACWPFYPTPPPPPAMPALPY